MPGNDNTWTGPRQRPLVYYTHTPPEAGPVLLGERCEVRISSAPGAPSFETIVREAAAADAICFFVPDVLDAALMDRLPAVRVLAGFGKARATTTSMSRRRPREGCG